MPKRWGNKTRATIYEFLVIRDGERCHNPKCGKTPEQAGMKKLEIDHIDGHTENWRPSNLQLLCKLCNLEKRRRDCDFYCMGIYVSENKHVQNGDYVKQKGEKQDINNMKKEGHPSTRIVRQAVDFKDRDAPSTMQANSLYELPFRTWLINTLTERGSIERHDAINSGAEYVGCSPKTAERYLAKMTSSAGSLKKEKNELGDTIITFKEEFTPKEEPQSPAPDGQKNDCHLCQGSGKITLDISSQYGNRGQRRQARKAGLPMSKLAPCPSCRGSPP